MLDRLGSVRVLPVVTVDRLDDAAPIARALADGGLGTIEITLRTPVAIDAIARVSDDLDDIVVGAGSVMCAADVSAAVGAGADYVVSPGFDHGVVERARELGVAAIPGVATATELQRAFNAGVDVVKVFPAAVAGGASLIRAFAAVWPSVRFLPTGGITEATAPDYLAVPSVLAVGGSWMLEPEAIADGDWRSMTNSAAAAVEIGRSGAAS